MIYLDNAATTPVRPEVLAAIQEGLAMYGNPSAIYQYGKRAKSLLNQARRSVAQDLGLDPRSIYFTSGATEADNWAIQSQAYQARELGLGDHLIVTQIEHPAVRETVDQLEAEGFQVTRLAPNIFGQYTVNQFQAASRPETSGWIAMTVNNETGSILPVAELGQAARNAGYWFHTDSVQAIGHPRVWGATWRDLLATSLVASAHKFGGPKGIGFLVYQPFRPEMTLQVGLYGGGQEGGLRAGTENLPFILGLAAAVRATVAAAESDRQRYADLAHQLYQGFQARGIDYQRNGDPVQAVDYIHNLWFPGTPSSQLLIKMDLAGIALSAGSACSAGSLEPSPILQAYYPDQAQRWQESVRISFGWQTQASDVTGFLDRLERIILG